MKKIILLLILFTISCASNKNANRVKSDTTHIEKRYADHLIF